MSKRITVNDLAKDLVAHKTANAERWKTVFNELNDIKSEVSNINSTIKTATFGVFGFIGALAIALITVMI
jgi:hypothetical protein|tara:strand:+ start:308 stop:517 length:210 start_codon:yes stop_codon:yes gene_type:complete